MADKMTPLQDLIPDFPAMLDVAREAVKRAEATPNDRVAVMSACLIVWHLRDWAPEKAGWDKRSLENCPWGTALDQVANAFKHSWVRESQPHRGTSPVANVKEIGGFGRGSYGVGPYGRRYIGLEASEHPGVRAGPVSMGRILREALAWWEAAGLA